MRKLVLSLLFALVAFPSFCQIKLLPKERIDSVAMARTTWCADFLEFDTLVLDAGTHSEDGGPVKAEFKFRNLSKESVLISKIETSCSCIDARPTKNLIKPAENAGIIVEYRPYGHKGIHPRYLHLYAKNENLQEELVAVLIFSSIIE